MSIDPFSAALGALVASVVWWVVIHRRSRERDQRASGPLYECTVCDIAYSSWDDARGHAESKHDAYTETMVKSLIRVVE